MFLKIICHTLSFFNKKHFFFISYFSARRLSSNFLNYSSKDSIGSKPLPWLIHACYTCPANPSYSPSYSLLSTLDVCKTWSSVSCSKPCSFLSKYYQIFVNIKLIHISPFSWFLYIDKDVTLWMYYYYYCCHFCFLSCLFHNMNNPICINSSS